MDNITNQSVATVYYRLKSPDSVPKRFISLRV